MQISNPIQTSSLPIGGQAQREPCFSRVAPEATGTASFRVVGVAKVTRAMSKSRADTVHRFDGGPKGAGSSSATWHLGRRLTQAIGV